MLQFKIPQNIKMPDQIIGPLTLEQFMYLLFACGIIYIAYIYVGYGNLFYIISIPVAILAVAFAFVPVNEQPFSKFVSNLIIYLIAPKVLVWQQTTPSLFDITAKKATAKEKAEEKEAILHPEEVKSQLQQISLILDTRVSAPQMATPPATSPSSKTTVVSTPLATPADTTPKPPSKFKQIFNVLFARPQAPAEPIPPTIIQQEQNKAKQEAIQKIISGK